MGVSGVELGGVWPGPGLQQVANVQVASQCFGDARLKVNPTFLLRSAGPMRRAPMQTGRCRFPGPRALPWGLQLS